MHSLSFKRSRGFSLIEMVISIAIIGVVLVIYQLSVSTTNVVRVSKDREAALRAAESELNSLRALGYAGLTNSTSSFFDAQISSLPSVSSTYEISTYNTTTKLVRVNISWTEPGNAATQKVVLSTLVTQTGGL